ncbi:MAG TPA: DUF6084 family protein [Solirubrobacterales bacterium]|nr:DUF6084 family protein [Solirubrobacterales bacterium]
MSATSPRPAAALDPVLDVHFDVEDAGMVAHAAVPTLRFAVRIRAAPERQIRSIMLDVQIQIAARRRSYDGAEKERLLELFGEAGRWGTTLRTLPWTRVSRNVPGFTGETLADLDVPCTYDFEVTAAKYLQALDGGEIPLELLFSGTVMYTSDAGLLQMARISWERDAEYGLPVKVWRETMDHYFPGAAWLRLSRETFDRLYAFRARNTMPSWEHALDALLAPHETKDEEHPDG